MGTEATPLTDDERAELEALRAEKAAREERAELEALRAEQEKADAKREAAMQTKARRREEAAGRPERSRTPQEDAHIREARDRGRKLMEPGDDLSMPTGQKIVLAVVAIAVIVVVAMFVFMPH